MVEIGDHDIDSDYEGDTKHRYALWAVSWHRFCRTRGHGRIVVYSIHMTDNLEETQDAC